MNLIVVLIEHDNNLGHVVELRDGAEVVHSSLPLRILLLLLRNHQKHKHNSASARCNLLLVSPADWSLTSSSPP